MGALAYASLYALVASQQFTHYAHPAGMSLTMAGIVPQEAVAILVRALRPVIVTTNAILLLFHVAAGFAVGWSAGRFWDEVRGRGGRAHAGWRRLAFVGGSLVAVAALAFTRTVVRYPFQYDHLLNAQGGSLRRLEQFLTSHLHPDLLDLSMGALIGCLALPAGVRAARRRPLAAATLVVAALGVAAWRSPAPAAGFNEGPNVVLILVESARSDALSLNGASWPTTPALDRMVLGGGVTFTNAWAHANGTVASVLTIMTSAYSHRHGVRSMFHNETFARPGLATLPAVLRDRGFATRVVTDWDGDTTYFNERMLPGFDRYDVAEFGMVNYVKQVYAQHFLFFALTDNPVGHRAFSTFYRAGGGYAPVGGDRYYLDRIESHLAELAGTKRFFLTLFFADPHINYRCPHPYYARFADPAYEGPNKYQAVSDPQREPGPGREGEARQIAGLYAGCMSAVDDDIGSVAGALLRLHLHRRTILVVTGDHGERLPDHRSFRFGRNGAWLDPAEFRVPLVIVNPQVPVARTVVATAARHIDIMPTILDLAGVPAPPGLAGTSLVPLFAGAESDRAADVFGETGFHWTPVKPPYLGYAPMTDVVSFRLDARGALIPRYFLRAECLPRIDMARHRFLRTARYQLNYRPTVEGSRLELFDWTADPDLQQDLVAARPAVLAELRGRLFRWALGDPDLVVRDGRLATRDPTDLTHCTPPR